METISNIPQLIERNTSVYLSRNLHYCHENRIYLYSWCSNIIIFCIFVVIYISLKLLIPHNNLSVASLQHSCFYT